jgi:uncharacterized membrane protein
MNQAHIHLLLNHIPLVVAGVAALLLAAALLRKNAKLKPVSLWLFVLAALITIPVYLTGEPAEEIVENLPGVLGPIVEQHERTALFSLIALEVLGVVSLSGLLIYRRAAELPKVFVVAALGLSIVAGGLTAWTANLGGQIRHSEIRSGALAGSPKSEGGESGEHEGGQAKSKGEKKHENE